MHIDELQERLRRIEVQLPHSTILRWRSEGLLDQPVVSSRGVGGGRGREVDWPDSTVPLVAAIFAVRNRAQPNQKTRRITTKTVSQLKNETNKFLARLEQYRDTDDEDQLFDLYDHFFSTVELKDPITLPDGRSIRQVLVLFSEKLDRLAKQWIATIEKVELDIPVTQPVALKYYFSPRFTDYQSVKGRNLRRYLFATLESSNADTTRIVPLSLSDTDALPQCIAKNDALLGIKMDNDWIRVIEDRNEIADQFAAAIASFTTCLSTADA